MVYIGRMCIIVASLLSSILCLVNLVAGQKDKVIITNLSETTSASNKIDNSKPVTCYTADVLQHAHVTA